MLTVWSDRDSTKRTIPTPASYEYTFSDVDKNSGRNDYGLMERNRIGSKVKLTLSWNAQKYPNVHNEMISLLKSLPPFFYCEYPDPDGSMRVIECYRGDIKTSMYRYDSASNSLWKETSCNFIER